MRYLYLILDVAAIIFPIILSFDSRVKFIRSWTSVIIASVLVGITFLVFDGIFTHEQYWGFNDSYLTGLKIINLPIEEVSFFLVVPFSCVFIYECCKYYIKKELSSYNQVFNWIYVGYTISIFALNPSGYYSLFVLIAGILSAIILFRSRLNFLQISLLISLIPFFIFNGILTGAVTETPIVWYDDINNSGFRLYTIPLEDIIYGFSLIIFVTYIHEKIKTFIK